MPLISTGLGEIFVEEQGRADGQPALLWPSLFTDHSMWEAQVAALATIGWRTLALDPPSHGLSPGVARTFTMDECADAAIAVLDAFHVTSPVVVFGTSWGGFIAPRIALRAPGRVGGLLLCATSAEGPLPSQRLKATVLASLFGFRSADAFVDRVNVSHLLSPETLKARPELGAAIVHAYRSWDRRRLGYAIRSVLLDRDSFVDRLGALQMPTLVVSGSADALLPSALGRRIASRMPQARFVEAQGAAHLIPLEKPSYLNKLILDFVQQRLP